MSGQVNGNLQALVKHRDAILLAEIGALIHDLGKLSEEFVSSKSVENTLNIEKDKHAKWFFDWYPEFENLLDINVKIMDKQILVKNIIKKHHGGNGSLLSIFSRAADGVDSGVDKGAVTNRVNKQSELHTYISTPFGYEFEKIDISSKQLKQFREKFINRLVEILENIQKSKSNTTLTAEEWTNLREELINFAKECFVHALGETRRSANDVTLWDHSYSTASLYKTALVGIVLSGQWKDPKNVKWRLLYIRFNGFDYITKSNKIGDILGRKNRIELALDLIGDLLEVHIPLGNEIYRDENGSVFLVPEDFSKDGLNKRVIGDIDPIVLLVKNEKIVRDRSKLNEFLIGDFEPDIAISIEPTDTIKSAVEKIFNATTHGELRPLVGVSKPSRGAVNLGKVLEKNKVLFNVPFMDELKRKWDSMQATICKVCGLKPCKKEGRGYADLCDHCQEIRRKRAEIWYDERVRYKSTIWIDEVCDKNKRVGVIVGAFELDDWLNGMWLNTTFTKTLKDLKKENPEVFREICGWKDLINAVKEALDKNDPNKELSFRNSNGGNIKVSELFKAIAPEAYRNHKAKDFFEVIVKNREEDVVKWAYYDEKTDICKLPNEQKANLLVLALFRKNPSFARIRRIWNTTKKFWDEIEGEIKKVVDTRERFRIIFNQKIGGLTPNHAYELRIDGHRIPVFYPRQYDEERTELIIIESWKEVGVDLKLLEKSINMGKFEIWEQSDYGTKSTKKYPNNNGDLRNISAKIEKDSNYYPYIQILKEPMLFVALVPLNRTWDIIKLIKREYEIQFSKVQNRLPIKLGLIAFKRKYPLYVVMDAVKRLINEKIEEREFGVLNSKRIETEDNCEIFDERLGNYASMVEVRGKNREFKFYMSYSLGDPDKEDEFYPYFVILESGDEDVDLETLLYTKYYLEKYNVSRQQMERNVKLKHVSKLKEGDKIIWEPSLFDFLFLDSNVRRFDIGKKRKHWLFTKSTNKPKPYLLWDIDNFERLRELVMDKLRLTTTQVMNLYEMLIEKIEDWNLMDVDKLRNDGTFEMLVENAIKSVPLRLKVVKDGESGNGKISKKDYEFLKESILNGMFFDFVDLWHTILKEKFEGRGEGNG